MKKRNVIQLIILLVLGIGVLFSLVTFDQTKSKDRELIEISVIFRQAGSSVWTATRQGMEQAAGDLGVELRILTPGGGDVAQEQRELLTRELEGGTDAIILIPADTGALGGEVSRAAERCTVVTMEADMSQDGAAACIGTDNAALGRALGEAVINGVSPGGTVLLMDSVPGSSAFAQRLAEAGRVLTEAGRTAVICSAGEDETLEQAFTAALNRTSPEGVIAFDASALELAAEHLPARSSALLYGFGSTGLIAALLEQGDIVSIAAQNDFAAGYLAVESAAKLVTGSRHGSAVDIPFSLIRQENMYDRDNQKLLFPVAR